MRRRRAGHVRRSRQLMTNDIGPILEGWPHEDGQITVRKIRGSDGRIKIQLRVDLGLLQMATEGRPDGQEPHGLESLLAHVEDLLERHRTTHGTDEGFSIDAEQCERLRAEAVQYYYRYLSEFVLEDYDAVVRDTDRNLRVLDVCAKYAADESDRFVMEQYRPYILMMSTRAKTYIALKRRRPKAARKTVNDALGRLKRFYSRFGQEDLYKHSTEVAALEELAREVEEKIAPNPVGKLKRLLAKAVEEERYEDAARLRDAVARAASRET